MYFILFDPIFWINKTLATFDRMVTKLQRQIDKVNAELEANEGISDVVMDRMEEKTQKMADKTNRKLLKIGSKFDKKKAKVVDKADTQVNAVRARNQALYNARSRAEITAKNRDKITKEEI